MKQYDVIAAGLLVMDVLVPGVDPVVYSEDTHRLDRIVYSNGGDAMNVAVNLANLGARVRFAGCVGDDAFSAYVRNAFKAAGIDAGMVVTRPGMNTATSIILGETNGERHVLYCPGANDTFDGKVLTEEELAKTSILHIGSAMGLRGLENGNLLPLLQRAKSQGVITVMDACGGEPDYDMTELVASLKYLDVFIPSLEEAQQISGMETGREATRFLLKHGVKLAGVKKGSAGSYISDGENEWEIPSYLVKDPVDTTGAGDAFMSGFIRGILLGLPYDECARLGSAVSHNCVQYIGATTHKTTLESAQAVVKAHE